VSCKVGGGVGGRGSWRGGSLEGEGCRWWWGSGGGRVKFEGSGGGGGRGGG